MLYDDRVAHLLTEALLGATSLTDVVLSGNPFSEGAAIGMADVLLANSAIEVLNDVPVRQLRADAIEELDLSLKRITSESASRARSRWQPCCLTRVSCSRSRSRSTRAIRRSLGSAPSVWRQRSSPRTPSPPSATAST